jgi:hypothetical protein
MKSRVIATIAVVLLFGLSGSMCGCFRDSKDFADMMRKVPVESTCFAYWDVHQLGTDTDLVGAYTKFRESPQAQQLMDVGVLLSVLERSVRAYGFGGSATVLEGDLDLEDIERRLVENGYTETVYRGIGIWTSQDGNEGDSLALQEGTILMGSGEDLRSCLDTIALQQVYSLYDDQNIRLLIDRLPRGLMVNVCKADLASVEAYDDLIALGKSYKKEGQDRLKLTAVYMFQDSYAAREAQTQIEGHLKTDKLANIRLEVEDSFVRVTALIYITDFVQTLAF